MPFLNNVCTIGEGSDLFCKVYKRTKGGYKNFNERYLWKILWIKASLESSRQACFHGSAKTLWWHSTTIIIAWRVVWSIYFTCIHSNRLRRERQKEQISKELWHQRRNLFVSGLESTYEVRGTVNRKLHKSVVCLKSSLAEDSVPIAYKPHTSSI